MTDCVRMDIALADPLWGQSCLAYNVHAGLDESCTNFLCGLQDLLLESRQPLLLTPAGALHSTIAYLISARASYDEPKDVLWARHGERWAQDLAQAAGNMSPFDMTFQHVTVSSRAVIVAASPVPQVDALRADVTRWRQDVGLPGRQPDILYVTLARYGPDLVDLDALAAHASHLQARKTARVRRLVLTEERRYPNLQWHAVTDLLLGTPRNPGTQDHASSVSQEVSR
ncbi:MAG TPA: 2'-5' RNA ligase family protein [Acidimicrobiales bacterium]|nr:2'-5' RNA ligase family protein [Acidimicrobiales bacterium]